jgi:hypothetical protein
MHDGASEFRFELVRGGITTVNEVSCFGAGELITATFVSVDKA